SLLGIDWYVNQLRYKVNESDPINVILSEEQVRGLAYLVVNDAQPVPQQGLLETMASISKQGPRPQSFPSVKTVTVPVDAAAVRNNGIVSAKDSVLPQISFDLPAAKGYYTLDQITILNVIAANAWKRPICFTSPDGSLGFGEYLQQRGLVYHLIPSAPSMERRRDINTDTAVHLAKNIFRTGNAQNPGVYFDEENRRHLLTIRSAYASLAGALADEGRKPEAVDVLKKVESMISTQAMPYAMTSSVHNQNNHNRVGLMYLEAAYRSGFLELAGKVKAALVKDLNDQLKYYAYLRDTRTDYYYSFTGDERDAQQFLALIKQWEEQYESKQTPPAINELPPGQRAADSAQRP
ncbi:MAG TPA: hypothetical protein VMR70_21645, partial [Flavisolibacter sp.]|nr:hypothetical protein [Flavisolibacter sp.]